MCVMHTVCLRLGLRLSLHDSQYVYGHARASDARQDVGRFRVLFLLQYILSNP